MPKPIPERGVPVPDPDHVLRYVKPTHIDGDQINGDAFLRKPGEDAPSTNWLEWFDPPPENQVSECRIAAGLRLKFSKTGKLAKLRVEHTKAYVTQEDPNHLVLAFEHDPLDEEDEKPADPSHAIIRGVPEIGSAEASLIGDLLAESVIWPLHSAHGD